MLKRVEKTLEKERQRDNRVYFCLAFHGNKIVRDKDISVEVIVIFLGWQKIMNLRKR